MARQAAPWCLCGWSTTKNSRVGSAGLDAHGCDPTARELLLDREPGDHGDAQTGHHGALDRVGIVERHRSCRCQPLTVPPRGQLPPRIGSLLAKQPRLCFKLTWLHDPGPRQR